MVTRITDHFALEEFACRDGSPYPAEWVDDRLRPLCATLEAVRAAAGGTPLTVDSGYRTLEYDQKIYDASPHDGTVAPPTSSQHPQGRAADVVHATMHPADLFNLVMSEYAAGRLPLLGGVGLYPSFVHLDCRPRPSSTGGACDGHLAIWGGRRPSNVV